MTESAAIRQIEIPERLAGERLDRALADLIPDLSRERLKALLKSGDISANGQPATSASKKVAAGQRYAVHIPQPIPDRAAPQDIPLSVVFEDEHLIVIDKPAGLVVHPAAGNPDGTLVNALLHHCGGSLSGIGGVTRPGIVHRIDKDTSGLLVAAKTSAAHMGLAAQFAVHSVGRRYLAAVRGRPNPLRGRIEGNIGRSSQNRKKMAVVEEGRGKPAVTHYRTVQVWQGAALVECELETGRTHQVRVHLAHIGAPLLGDPVYGGRAGKTVKALTEGLNFNRQALHAAHLQFQHPDTKEILSFDAPLPADMTELVSALSRS
ncbi:MAG: RluA family pseudouridine synthase [Pacificimonas sp.]|nr:RluA family pseudouridine synthase [Pacificimonas sp.]